MTSNFLQLSSPWSDLQSNLKDVIGSATVLLTEQIESAEEFQEYLTRYTAWDQEAMNLLKESFTETNNQLVIEFSQVMDNAFHIQGKVPNFHTQASNLKKRIENKIAYLLYNERILNVCDAIVRPESIDLEKRASLNFKQKQSLILENYMSFMMIQCTLFPKYSPEMGLNLRDILNPANSLNLWKMQD